MRCINLKERFGGRYKVEFEEGYYAELPEFRAVEASWLMIIRCQNGFISPWGNNLSACTSHPGRVVKKLKTLPFTTVAQDGDDGGTVVFPVEHFDEVAKIMKPRKRRQVSEAERQRLAEMSARYSPLRKKPPIPFPESPENRGQTAAKPHTSTRRTPDTLGIYTSARSSRLVRTAFSRPVD